MGRTGEFLVLPKRVSREKNLFVSDEMKDFPRALLSGFLRCQTQERSRRLGLVESWTTEKVTRGTTSVGWDDELSIFGPLVGTEEGQKVATEEGEKVG